MVCGLSMYYIVSDNFISRNHTWERDKYPRCITRGKVEKSISKIVGVEELSAYLETMSTAGVKKGIVEFNSTLDSTQLVELVKDAITKNDNIKISTFSIIYIKKLNCIVIVFEY